MAKSPDDHAGSGLDKPDPKTLLEKAKDSLKSVLPKQPDATRPETPTGNGTVQRIPGE